MQLPKIATLLTTPALLAFALLAFAQAHAEEAAPAPVQPPHMMEADTNHDGKISHDEFRAASEKRSEQHFKRMDTNGDGFIDQAERQAAHEKMREHRMHHEEMHEKPAPAKPN